MYKYAYGKGNFEDYKELRITKIDHELGLFNGEYKSINGSTYVRMNQAIKDYEFYNDDTEI